MFVYLSGSEKGKTRIFTQDHVTIGTSESCDLKLVPEDGGSLADGILADIYNDDEAYHLVPRDSDRWREIAINGENLTSDGQVAGYPLRDGDTLIFGEGLSSASVLFQVLPVNFGATHPVRRGPSDIDRPAGQQVHPLTATLFVKELSASLWAEIPRRAKIIGLTALGAFIALIIAAVVYNFIGLHRNAVENGRLIEQLANLSERSQQDQNRIMTQQNEIDTLRKSTEQARAFAQMVAERYSPGVCLIVGSYSFVERGTGRPLRYESADDANDTVVDQHGNPVASVTGAGPPVEMEWTGTGFLVEDGLIVTNRHVVQPTETDQRAQVIMRQGPGFRAKLDSLVAFFPSLKTPFELRIKQVADRHDLALCALTQGNIALPALPLGSDDMQKIIGEQVVLLGYPTGVDGLLQRIEESERREILSEHGKSAEDVAAGLASRGLIRPLTTTGVISDALPGRVVHSAHTIEGGSGGPIFDREGHVIAINQAVLTPIDGGQSFGGSNFGVPVRAAKELIAAYGNAGR